ncbi:MAG: globin-coupled sensor protein [Sphingomonadales bacterium]|nr:globin-coupled sensor protein [Sphingomonadales bacterium]
MTPTDTEHLAKAIRFHGIGQADYRRFPALRDALRRLAPAALERFYDKVRATPETAAFFPTEHVLQHAKGKQIQHWDRLFAGPVDDAAAARSETIGNVHARIGLSPGWYIGAYATVLEDLIVGMGRSGLGRLLGFGQRAAQAATLVKLALFDMDVALSAYFKAEEQARREVIARFSQAMAALAAGDFSAELSGLPPEYAQLQRDYEAMRGQIGDALRGVAQGARGIDSSSSEIRQASDDLANRTSRQAASLEEAAANMTELTQGIRGTADSAVEMTEAARTADAEAKAGGQVVCEAVVAMQGIQKSSLEIRKIVDVIDAIAFQTNLLALNAGVEAARAGETGRGFAVVATEVRALAQRSAEAANDIKKLINASATQVEDGVGLVGRSGEAFDSIAARITMLAGLAGEMSDRARDQAGKLQQANVAVVEMDQLTQHNAAMVEQATAASRSLAIEAEQLAELVGRFRLEGQRAPGLRRAA